ncbi:MAG: hypothetical protein NC102_01455 [Clostridium sp.]|nr:hypothetical protein [Clostridium sp.]
MSSESISPKAFYAVRGFGYRTWHLINENPYDNSILFYEEMPKVVRQESDYDDYPMVIAISVSDELLNKLSRTVVDGVYQYSGTVYLNPFNTAFIFDAKERKQIALSKSESSAESKMVSLYQYQMKCAESFCSYDISLCKDLAFNREAMQKDQRINKIKGFLYGYYVGAALSMSPADVEKLNILYNIKNVIAAIISSINGGTKEHYEQIDKYFSLLKKFDPVRAEIYKLIEANTLSTQEKVDLIFSRLENYKDNISTAIPFIIKEAQKRTSGNGDNQAMLWINKQIENNRLKSKTHPSLLSIDNKEVIISNLELSVINNNFIQKEIAKKVFLSIVNDILASNKYNGKISTFQLELATEITIRAKEIYGDAWNDTCRTRAYLNALRRHIAGEAFNYAWDSGVLSSVAAVILKGDDWEKLLGFLQVKNLADYRIAFALYGELNGFANLTRDFTDILLMNEDSYVYDILRNFFYQIHGEELKNINVSNLKIVRKSQQASVFPTAKTPTIEKTPISSATPTLFERFLAFLKKSLNPRTTIFKEIKKNYQGQIVEVSDLNDLVNGVLDNNKNRPDQCEKAKQALEQFNKEYAAENAVGEAVAASLKFIFDKDASKLVMNSNILPCELKESMIKDLVYIQREYEPGGRHEAQDHANWQTIKHFINLSRKNLKRQRIYLESYEVVLEDFKKYLDQHYGVDRKDANYH